MNSGFLDTTTLVFAAGIVFMGYLSRRLAMALTSRLFPELMLLRTAGARDAAFRAAKPFFRLSSNSSIFFFVALLLSGPAGILSLLAGLRVPLYVAHFSAFAVLSLFFSCGNVLFARRRITRNLRRQLVDRTIPICVGCGYDLRGQRDPRCPECGESFDAALVSGDAHAQSIAGVATSDASSDAELSESITFEYTDELLRSAMRAYWWRLQGRRVIGSVLFTTAIFAYLLYELGDSWMVGVFGALIAVQLVSMIKTRIILVDATLKKWCKHDDRTAHFRFSNSGVEIELATSSSRVAWDKFEKLWKCSSVWFLFLSEHEPMIIPAAALSDDLRTTITRKLMREGVLVG